MSPLAKFMRKYAVLVFLLLGSYGTMVLNASTWKEVWQPSFIGNVMIVTASTTVAYLRDPKKPFKPGEDNGTE